jgi:hypothetical protein
MGMTVAGITLAAVFALASPGTSAQVEVDPAFDTVKELVGSSSPETVINAVMNTGKTLPEATVYAMVAGGEANRVVLATAGVGMAGNLAQAREVGNAVMAAAGETGPVADAVRVALDEYARHMDQPSVYEDEYSPGGGGISPSV